jgi:hypothetical protein
MQLTVVAKIALRPQACNTYAALFLVSLLAATHHPPSEQASIPRPENRRWTVFVCLLRVLALLSSAVSILVGKYCMRLDLDPFA